MDAIDIHDPLAEICERLGLDYKNVAELVITPGTVEAKVFAVNEDGAKYVLPNGEVAFDESREFTVRS